ncbi:MAG: pilin [bacterium]|nr:pilin [bacterium]
MRTHLFILTALLLFATSGMFIAHAQTDYIPLASIPNITDVGKTTTSLPTYLTGLYKTGIAAAGILAVLMLVWGGFQYATTEAVSGKSESKGIIMNVVWGLATVLASYVLLYTINPRLVDIGLALAPLKSVTKTRIPTAQETYGARLDAILKQVNSTSLKARELKAQADGINDKIARIQSNIDNGVFEDEDGNEMPESELQAKINVLRNDFNVTKTLEGGARFHEQALNQIEQASGNIVDCLNGQGPCSRYVSDSGVSKLIRTALFGNTQRTNAQLAADQAAATESLNGLRNYTNEEIRKLNNLGLTEKATDLQNKLNAVTTKYEFFKACPNAKAVPANWQPGNTNCQ